MARRPVFVPTPKGKSLVATHSVEFQWHAGLSVSQKQKSIASLHDAAKAFPGVSQLLEVSSKSTERLGVALSAFNLTFLQPGGNRLLSVECAFQGSKVFENGGPFVDLFGMAPREAKRDIRLQTCGRLLGFRFDGLDWGLEPQTAFYDWLYINALKGRKDLAEFLLQYSAFTDIEFNPERSINCQAYSVALFVSLRQVNRLDEVARSAQDFLNFIRSRPMSSSRQNDFMQDRLF